MGQGFQGTTIKLSVDGIVAMVALGEITGYSFEDGERGDIDVTHSTSTKKEYLSGLAEADNISFDMNYVLGGAGLALAKDSKDNDIAYFWELEFTDGTLHEFNGVVKAMPHSGGVDDKLSGSVNIRLTTGVTETPPV